jgi:hypothetical protein
VLEGDERRRLLLEAVEPPRELLLGARAHRPHGEAVGGARGEALRQVFLDRDLAADHRFFGEIGDAEAARAEQAQDAVAVERVPDRQGVDVGVRQGSLRQNPESFPGAAKIKRNARPLNAHLRSRSP